MSLYFLIPIFIINQNMLKYWQNLDYSFDEITFTVGSSANDAVGRNTYLTTKVIFWNE